MALFPHFLEPPPPPMWHFLSTFTSEITNKNCPVTFLLTPPLPPKVSRIIWMAPNSVLTWKKVAQFKVNPCYLPLTPETFLSNGWRMSNVAQNIFKEIHFEAHTVFDKNFLNKNIFCNNSNIFCSAYICCIF